MKGRGYKKQGNTPAPALYMLFLGVKHIKIPTGLVASLVSSSRSILNLRLALARPRSLRYRSAATAGRRALGGGRGRVLKERDEIRVLAGWSLRVGGELAHDAVIGRSVGVNLDALLPVETTKRAICGKGNGVALVVAPLNGRPSGDTAGNNTGHCGGGPERRVGSGPCVAS